MFDSVTTEPDLRSELRVLRFKLVRVIEPLEREIVVGTPKGAEKATLQIDEVQRIYAIVQLVDGIRKVVKELPGDGDERFERLLSVLMIPPPHAPK